MFKCSHSTLLRGSLCLAWFLQSIIYIYIMQKSYTKRVCLCVISVHPALLCPYNLTPSSLEKRLHCAVYSEKKRIWRCMFVCGCWKVKIAGSKISVTIISAVVCVWLLLVSRSKRKSDSMALSVWSLVYSSRSECMHPKVHRASVRALRRIFHYLKYYLKHSVIKNHDDNDIV